MPTQHRWLLPKCSKDQRLSRPVLAYLSHLMNLFVCFFFVVRFDALPLAPSKALKGSEIIAFIFSLFLPRFFLLNYKVQFQLKSFNDLKKKKNCSEVPLPLAPSKVLKGSEIIAFIVLLFLPRFFLVNYKVQFWIQSFNKFFVCFFCSEVD